MTKTAFIHFHGYFGSKSTGRNEFFLTATSVKRLPYMHPKPTDLCRCETNIFVHESIAFLD